MRVGKKKVVAVLLQFCHLAQVLKKTKATINLCGEAASIFLCNKNKTSYNISQQAINKNNKGKKQQSTCGMAASPKSNNQPVWHGCIPKAVRKH